MVNKGLRRLVGFCLIVLAASMVATTMSFGAATEDSDTSRDEIQQFLRDVEDNESIFAITIGAQVVQAAAGLAIGAGLFTLLRTRQTLFAALGLALLAAGAASTMVNAGANFALAGLAGDLAEGGAGGAGEPEILQISRAVGLFDSFAFASSIALVGLSIAAFGWALRDSEEPLMAAPRWLSLLGAAGGLLCVFAWPGLMAEEFFGLAFLGQLLVVVYLVALGGWLLLRADQSGSVSSAMATA